MKSATCPKPHITLAARVCEGQSQPRRSNPRPARPKTSAMSSPPSSQPQRLRSQQVAAHVACVKCDLPSHLMKARHGAFGVREVTTVQSMPLTVKKTTLKRVAFVKCDLPSHLMKARHGACGAREVTTMVQSMPLTQKKTTLKRVSVNATSRSRAWPVSSAPARYKPLRECT